MALFKSAAWDVDVSSKILNNKLFGVVSRKRKGHITNGQNSRKKLKSHSKSTTRINTVNHQDPALLQDDKFGKIKRENQKISSTVRKKRRKNKLADNQKPSIDSLSTDKLTKKQKVKAVQHELDSSVLSRKKSPSNKKSNALSSLKSHLKRKKTNKFTLPVEESSKSGAEVKIDTYQAVSHETPQRTLLTQSSKHADSVDSKKSRKAKKKSRNLAPVGNIDAHYAKPVLKHNVLPKGESINKTDQLNKTANSGKKKLTMHQRNVNSGHIIQDNLKIPTRRNPGTLRERMLKRLQASRFRYLNQQMYCSQGKEALEYFQTDPAAFHAYHHGYRQQLAKWPLNPLNTIINSLKKKSSELIIADFGCGNAQLAQSLPNTVHSFDLVALSEEVTVCDMAHTPLGDSSVDIAVFCLSLMGTNLTDYLREANRLLKMKGIMKIAEVESRFEDVSVFIKTLMKYGFTIIHKDLSHNLFYFMDFQKVDNIKKKKIAALPPVSLKPCLYKKR